MVFGLATVQPFNGPCSLGCIRTGVATGAEPRRIHADPTVVPLWGPPTAPPAFGTPQLPVLTLNLFGGIHFLTESQQGNSGRLHMNTPLGRLENVSGLVALKFSLFKEAKFGSPLFGPAPAPSRQWSSFSTHPPMPGTFAQDRKGWSPRQARWSPRPCSPAPQKRGQAVGGCRFGALFLDMWDLKECSLM